MVVKALICLFAFSNLPQLPTLVTVLFANDCTTTPILNSYTPLDTPPPRFPGHLLWYPVQQCLTWCSPLPLCLCHHQPHVLLPSNPVRFRTRLGSLPCRLLPDSLTLLLSSIICQAGRQPWLQSILLFPFQSGYTQLTNNNTTIPIAFLPVVSGLSALSSILLRFLGVHFLLFYSSHFVNFQITPNFIITDSQ